MAGQRPRRPRSERHGQRRRPAGGDTLDEQQRQLRAERADLTGPDQVADIDRRLAELARRCRDLDDHLARFTAKASLWTSGHRPRDVTDAINRRSQYLAHTAITNGDQWVTETVRAWHTAHPDGAIHRLQRTVIEIAAYRERSGHTGGDPLGPAPDAADTLRVRWQQLHNDLHVCGDLGATPLTL